MSTEIKSIIESLQRLSDGLENGAPGAREGMMDRAYKLISKLELPSEAIQRMGWAEPARLAHCQIAVDLGLFDILAQKQHASKGADVKTLASLSKADETILARLLRHLTAMNVLDEVSPDRYRSTPFALALTEPRFRDGIKYINAVPGPAFRSLPSYFAQTNYRDTATLSDGPFQYAHDTKSPFFAWLGENPELLGVFSNYMAAYRAGKPTWSDAGFYPLTENLADDFRGQLNSVILVDVGGGKGHDLKELKEKHPNIPGMLILQDQPDVIASIPAEDAAAVPFKATAHDFFTPQPVQKARAYYLHSVLHDWSDDDCVKILSNLVPAMEPGYSKVLINEIVVPESGAAWPVTSMDWLMMALGGMRERTQKEWEAIVQRAGLKVSNIYTYQLGTESLIEAELP